MPNVTLTTVYDNYAVIPRFTTGWGFACVANVGDKKLLFDTGGDGSILLANMEIFEFDLNAIEMVVLSHNHPDHTGGLAALLAANNKIKVYIPKSFPDEVREGINAAGAEYIDVTAPVEICENVHTTGEMGDKIIEQSLVIESDYGLLVLTGCAHPGIVDVLNKAKQICNEDIFCAIGGIHLKDKNETEIRETIVNLRGLLRKIGPSHCSGDLCREVFEKEFAEDYILGGVGNVIGA
jgi:7,8-dihydropterin-6-yl-methyl-4-(beta-D-ribofuranosyl)aminobenzene 5'-phosphate synthase